MSYDHEDLLIYPASFSKIRVALILGLTFGGFTSNVHAGPEARALLAKVHTLEGDTPIQKLRSAWRQGHAPAGPMNFAPVMVGKVFRRRSPREGTVVTLVRATMESTRGPLFHAACFAYIDPGSGLIRSTPKVVENLRQPGAVASRIQLARGFIDERTDAVIEEGGLQWKYLRSNGSGTLYLLRVYEGFPIVRSRTLDADGELSDMPMGSLYEFFGEDDEDMV